MAPPQMKNWKVLSRTDLTHDVFELKLARPADVTFKGGQYMSIVIPGAGPGGRNLRRAYSIASPPEYNEVELCVKTVAGGPGTTYLGSLKVGDELQAQAPFGDFYLEHDQELPALFIGTGTGLAPLRSMVLSNDWKSQAKLGFLLGVRDEKDIIYPEIFDELKKRPSTVATICLSRPADSWKGFKGRVTDYIRALDWDFAKTHYYLCGSGAMLTEVKDFLMNHKSVPKDQIHTEKYY